MKQAEQKYKDVSDFRKLCKDFENFKHKNSETINKDWHIFPAGTKIDKIEKWFEEETGEKYFELQYGLLDVAVYYILNNMDEAVPYNDYFCTAVGTVIDAELLLGKTMKLLSRAVDENNFSFMQEAKGFLAEYKNLKGE